jgi:hypothetical protein
MTISESSAHVDPHGAAAKVSTRFRLGAQPGHGLRVQMAFAAAAVCAVGLVAWMVVLGLTLPGRYEVNHWEPTWLGFDTILFLGFASTAWTIRNHRTSAMLFAIATGTLLTADAWFDVLTASGQGLLLSVGTAVLVELPLAAWLFYTAVQVFNHALESARESVSSHPADTHGDA